MRLHASKQSFTLGLAVLTELKTQECDGHTGRQNSYRTCKSVARHKTNEQTPTRHIHRYLHISCSCNTFNA